MQFGNFCFANFKQLAVINKYTQDIDTSILFGAVRYQIGKTKIVKEGKNLIIRTRRKLADYIGCSLSKIDSVIKNLKELSLIGITLGLWYGKKRMFINCKEEINFKINVKKLTFMNAYTGSTQASLMLSYFAYEIGKDIKTSYGPGWGRVPKKDIAKLLMVSIRTAHRIANTLEHKGFIDLKGQYCGVACFVVRIKQDKYDDFSAAWDKQTEEEKAAQILVNRDKITTSINNRYINTVEIKNNNIENAPSVSKIENGDVNFSQSVLKLSNKELGYAKAAVERTILAAKVAVDDIQTLWGQVKFALSTPQHRKGTQNFKHAVNRFMLLIRSGVWRAPFGYEKYNSAGKAEYERLRAHEKAHEYAKLPPKPCDHPKIMLYQGVEYFESPQTLKSSVRSSADVLKNLGVSYVLAEG